MGNIQISQRRVQNYSVESKINKGLFDTIREYQHSVNNRDDSIGSKNKQFKKFLNKIRKIPKVNFNLNFRGINSQSATDQAQKDVN